MEVFNETKFVNNNTINSDILKLNKIRKRLLNISKLFNDYTFSNKDRINELVLKVNSFSHDFKKMGYDKFREYAQNKSKDFQNKLKSGTRIEEIMCEAIAIAREAIRKSSGVYAYDTQIEACLALVGNLSDVSDYERQRVVAQMSSGEGKSIVQILIGYLYLLDASKYETQKSVHVVNYNSYLAQKDMQNASKAFDILGFSCAFLPNRKDISLLSKEQLEDYIKERKELYKKDIVYTTLSTLALDYLDDNTALNKSEKYMSKPFGYLIIDTADIILLDEALSPFKLIGTLYGKDGELDYYLNKKKNEKIDLYKWATNFVYGDNNTSLTYIVYDEFLETNNNLFTQEYAYIKDTDNVVLSVRLKDRLERICACDDDVYNEKYGALVNVIKARHSYINGKDYVVKYDKETKEGTVELLNNELDDKKTRDLRLAIEAKEAYYHKLLNSKHKILYKDDKELKAICTCCDFISMYSLGVSALASNSSEELKTLYGFETYKIENRKKNIRIDEEYLYATIESKYKAILESVLECVKKGQPVLISASNTQEFNDLDKLLNDNRITHNLIINKDEQLDTKLLNMAGNYGVVSLTNDMSVYAADIKLGEGVKELGGLLLINASYKNSRRLDSEFKEITARQSNPGTVKSYASLEDKIVSDCFTDSNGKNKVDLFIKQYDNGKEINNLKIKDIILQSQEHKERIDKSIRDINTEFGRTYSHLRKSFYEERDTILNSSTVQMCKLTENIITEYANIVANKYDNESAKKLLDHLIDVDSCYDSDKVIFKELLKNKLIDLFKERTLRYFDIIKIRTLKESPKEGISKEEVIKQISHEYDNIIDSLRKKYLHLMDIYHMKYINELESIRSSNSISKSTNPLKEYKLEANNEFFNNMYPSIYNEMITYALNLNYNLGDYKISKINNQNVVKRVFS